LSGVFRIDWPPEFTAWLAYLKIFNFDFINMVQLECVWRYNFLSALVLRTVLPLAVVGTLVFLGQRALRRGNESMGYGLFNFGVLLIFIFYPGVTQMCFRFFQTHPFDGDYGTFLVADYSVNISGEAYQAMTPFAIVMVVVWPFGVPVMIAFLLWRAIAPLQEIRRRERILGNVYDGDCWKEHIEERRSIGDKIQARDETEPIVEGYLWSLTESYRGSAFYFEVIEYALQKLTLVGLLVFFRAGSIEQLTLGLIVCFIYFGLCCYLLPFGTRTDNLMACVTQFSLFVTMLSAVIIEYGAAEPPQAVIAILTAAAFVPIVLGIALSVYAVFNECGIDPGGAANERISRRAAPLVRHLTQRISRREEGLFQPPNQIVHKAEVEPPPDLVVVSPTDAVQGSQLQLQTQNLELEKMNLELLAVKRQNLELQERLNEVLKSKELTSNEPTKTPLADTIESWKGIFSPTAASVPNSQTTSAVAQSDCAPAASHQDGPIPGALSA